MAGACRGRTHGFCCVPGAVRSVIRLAQSTCTKIASGQPGLSISAIGWRFAPGRHGRAGISLSLIPASLIVGSVDWLHTLIALSALSLFPVKRLGGMCRSGGPGQYPI